MLQNLWETCIKIPVTCEVIWHHLRFTQGAGGAQVVDQLFHVTSRNVWPLPLSIEADVFPHHNAGFNPSENSPLKCFCHRPALHHRKLFASTPDDHNSCSRLEKPSPPLTQEHALQKDPVVCTESCFLGGCVCAAISVSQIEGTSLLHPHHAKLPPHDLKHGGKIQVQTC